MTQQQKQGNSKSKESRSKTAEPKLQRRPKPIFLKLKPERIQEPVTLELQRRPKPVFLKPERIQDMLEMLPGWVVSGRRFLLRTREFPTPLVAEWYGAFVAALAASLGALVQVDVLGSQVFVRVWGEARKGWSADNVTDAVLGLAQHLG